MCSDQTLIEHSTATAVHGRTQAGFGIYVHWPFCRAKCPYCDFNSHVRSQVDAAAYTTALITELDVFAARIGRRTVDSIFFGGGTPSLMPPEAVARVIEAVARLWPLASDAEITLEANPTSAEAEKFAGYHAAGVNRVSIGVQALNDIDLRVLGREHTVAEALAAVAMARRIFPRFSFDLIYARPGQSATDWNDELERALGEAGGHLALYQLTIEPGTAFAAEHAGGRLMLPSDEECAELYETTQALCQAAGLPAYEVSNHARPGHESRHNLIYWRGGDYLGVGPGAHSRMTEREGRTASQAIRAPEAWLRAVLRDGHAIAEEVPLSREEQGEEYLLMGLRIVEGISLSRLEALCGMRPTQEALRELVADGLLVHDGASDRIAATPRGRQVLNALIAAIAATMQ